MCESFFATLECELLDRHKFKNQIEARLAVFDFIEGWYNPHRRHSSLAYESPITSARINCCRSASRSSNESEHVEPCCSLVLGYRPHQRRVAVGQHFGGKGVEFVVGGHSGARMTRCGAGGQ